VIDEVSYPVVGVPHLPALRQRVFLYRPAISQRSHRDRHTQTEIQIHRLRDRQAGTGTDTQTEGLPVPSYQQPASYATHEGVETTGQIRTNNSVTLAVR